MIFKIVYGYFDLYLLLHINIKSDMNIAPKIANNFKNENRFSLKGQLIKAR